MALISFIVLLLNTCIKPQFSEDIQTTYVGISAFLLLVFISQYAQKANIVCKICSFVSKYSYAIFLVHHVIIWYTMMKFDLYSISHLESYLIFIGLFVVILLLSKILFEVDKFVEKEAKQLFSYLRIKKVDRKDY